MFEVKHIRKKKLFGKYEVGDDGVVYSDGMPLEAIGGVGVNLNGMRVKICYLVARAFVPNGECREFVRHKNGDIRDNRACNLEWCDQKEVRKRGRNAAERWCMAWDLQGERVGCWRSPVDAARELGLKVSAVRSCLYGRQKQAGGYLWGWCQGGI